MYQTIGGAAGLTKVVDNFYERLWADPELRHYFDNIDKTKLKEHQRAFLTFALGGGTDAYNGKPLNQAHIDLHITNAAFDKVAWHLKLTLEELDVDRPLISIILGFVEGARSQVISQPF
jgi:hemoglobin